MDRRELLALAGVAAVTGASVANAQRSNQGLKAKLIHVYATPDGESHIETLEIANDAGSIPVSSMTASAYGGNVIEPDWHTAPARQFAINMSGTLEVEISDGSRHEIGQGDLVFIEDITGKGHVTRVLTPVTNLFIRVPQDWDVVAWARGSGAA